MRKIIILLIALVLGVVAMSYIYFSKMDKENDRIDLALQIASNGSSLIFSFQNNKSFYQIIESQTLIQQLLSKQSIATLNNFKNNIIDNDYFNAFINDQELYLSIIPDEKKELNFLFTAQIKSDKNLDQLKNKLITKNNAIQISSDIYNIKFNDSLNVYFYFKNKVISASTSLALVKNTSAIKKGNQFTAYIKANNQNKKNVLATLYLNFNKAPVFTKSLINGSIDGNLNLLNNQDSYATLNYNFSKEKILFNGNTELKGLNNYLKLFENTATQNITITSLLPENTSNYTLYAMDNYKNWQKRLKLWFSQINENEKIEKIINNIENQYRTDLNTIFPIYTKNQFITFQLSTSEKLAAISLSNGEKVKQLLLDISANYTEDIKQFKASKILYSYFGEPFIKFDRPYYTIIDNNLIVANNASTIESFLNSYKNNKLLIQSPVYLDAINQISSSSNISFFVNLKNSDKLLRNNLTKPFYKQLESDNGLKPFDTFYYQMNADKEKFITNLLLNKYLAPEL